MSDVAITSSADVPHEDRAAVVDGLVAYNAQWGCIGIYLDTYSFQARPFYERQGYTVFGVLADMPPGGAKYYLSKQLDTPRPSAG
jgi:hypothetical protein